jgi:opacity protein-like surface antigen
MVKNIVYKMFAACVATIIVMTFSQASMATNGQVALNQHQGLYAEATLGADLYYLGVISVPDDSDMNLVKQGFPGFGYSAAIGYQFRPGGFALEGGFMQNFFDLSEDLRTGHGNERETVTESTTLYTPYAAMRWEFPIKQRLAFIPKLGIAYVKMKETTLSNDDQTVVYGAGTGMIIPYVGLGFSYALTQKIDVVLQYQGAVLGIAGAGLASLGLDYHF